MQKSLKWLLAGAVSLGILALALPSRADTVNVPASVQFIGAGVANMTVGIQTLAGTAASAIAWNSPTVNSGWQLSDNVITLAAQVTDAAGVIQITGANGGMVSGASVLPLAWRVRKATSTPASALVPEVGNPGAPEYEYGWFFVAKSTTATGIANPEVVYRTVFNSQGAHVGTDVGNIPQFDGDNDSQCYIYIESNFDGAGTSATGVTYSETITLGIIDVRMVIAV